jgi:hypothetical protein
MAITFTLTPTRLARLKVYPYLLYKPSHETPLKHATITRDKPRGEAVGGRVTADDYQDCLKLLRLLVPVTLGAITSRAGTLRAGTLRTRT